jgi:anti-sigma B factor antagonist
MEACTVTSTITDNVALVHVVGYLDAQTAQTLEDQLRGLVEQRSLWLIVDFEHLDYISSAGLGVFMMFIEDVRSHGHDILLTSMKPAVYSVFDLLGFFVLFSYFPTTEAALNSLLPTLPR